MSKQISAVEWLENEFKEMCKDFGGLHTDFIERFEKAKKMEKNDTDNKVIHFAEWLTNKHTTTLITLYEQFEEQYYNEKFKSE